MCCSPHPPRRPASISPGGLSEAVASTGRKVSSSLKDADSASAHILSRTIHLPLSLLLSSLVAFKHNVAKP